MKDGMVKVLIVDDDVKLCGLVKDYLEPMGYAVTAAHDGRQGLELAASDRFDVVILDVMLPEMDGFEVLRELRRQSDLPVLMLTARGDETDRVVGLEMGADDYLPKTFSSRELLARLRAVTRRSLAAPSGRNKPEQVIAAGDLVIDPAACRVSLNGSDLDLTPIEYKLLLSLVSAAGRVLSRDHLLDDAAGRDWASFDRSVDMHVSSLRRKLGDDPRRPRYIKTVRAFGYMWIGLGAEGS